MANRAYHGLKLGRLLAAGAAVLVAGCAIGTRAPAAHVRTSPSAPVAATPGSIEAFVPTAVSFVEAHRGLRFKQPVNVNHLSDADFSSRIVSLQRRDRADTDRQAKLLKALGLISPGVDVEKAEEELLGSGVVGYYDPKTKELVVRGDSATVSVRHVVVHELTHALQDQWFGLDDGQRQQTDDASLAYTALVEGDAVRVEREYVASLPPGDRSKISSEGGGGPPSDVPRVLIELLGFPYVVGPPFTTTLLQSRGQAGLDRAFRERPTATAQVLHPDRFLQADQPQVVAEPAADGEAFDHGVFGEAQLRLLLEDLALKGGLSVDQERAAAEGWAGDRYVAWSSGARSCVRVRFALRTGSAATALGGALQKLAATEPDASVQRGTEPVLTTCA
jgi:hypothetical protein